MKKVSLIILICFILAIGFTTVYAQNEPTEQRPNVNAQPKPNLLRLLNLTPEQVQQIRKIKQGNREIIQAAERRQRQTRKALDEAIYGDTNDNDFQSKLREFQDAQSDLTKLRANDELAIRRVLTPEQLSKFIELRQRMIQKQKNKETEPNERPFRQNMQKRKIISKNISKNSSII